MVIRPKAYASDIYPIQPSSAYERNKKCATLLQQCNYCTYTTRDQAPSRKVQRKKIEKKVQQYIY